MDSDNGGTDDSVVLTDTVHVFDYNEFIDVEDRTPSCSRATAVLAAPQVRTMVECSCGGITLTDDQGTGCYASGNSAFRNVQPMQYWSSIQSSRAEGRVIAMSLYNGFDRTTAAGAFLPVWPARRASASEEAVPPSGWKLVFPGLSTWPHPEPRETQASLPVEEALRGPPPFGSRIHAVGIRHRLVGRRFRCQQSGQRCARMTW